MLEKSRKFTTAGTARLAIVMGPRSENYTKDACGAQDAGLSRNALCPLW